MRFLTEPGDVVLDIFAGSNTTGSAAEGIERRWMAFEESREYIASSGFRFLRKGVGSETMRAIYDDLAAGRPVDLSPYVAPAQMRLR